MKVLLEIEGQQACSITQAHLIFPATFRISCNVVRCYSVGLMPQEQ